MKKWVFLLLLGLCSSFSNETRPITVLIDAGHGGKDHGHLSQFPGLKPEKDITLSISKILGGYIEKYLGNVKVIYTRKADQFISLDERVDMANNLNADYFISVHCNGNPKPNVHGTETHIHNFNAKKSVRFAKNIEDQFANRAGRHSRGTKNNADRGHSVQVLKFTTMTSVLVECGFLTNKREANYLNTTNGQELIASALFRALRKTAKQDFPSLDFTPGAKSGNYAVQIMSSKSPIDTSHESFIRLKMNVTREELNTKNAYKYAYYLGPFNSKSEAIAALNRAKKRGFPDAYLNVN